MSKGTFRIYEGSWWLSRTTGYCRSTKESQCLVKEGKILRTSVIWDSYLFENMAWCFVACEACFPFLYRIGCESHFWRATCLLTSLWKRCFLYSLYLELFCSSAHTLTYLPFSLKGLSVWKRVKYSFKLYYTFYIVSWLFKLKSC
jgi:hypothetical protein